MRRLMMTMRRLGLDRRLGVGKLALTLLLLCLTVGCGAGGYASQETQAASHADYAGDGSMDSGEASLDAAEGSYQMEEQLMGQISASSSKRAAPRRAKSLSAPATSPQPTGGVGFGGGAGPIPPGGEPTPPPDPENLSRHPGEGRPMLIYRAELGLAVFQVQDNLDAIEGMAKKVGGYLVRRSQNQIVVRVPAELFEETVAHVLKLGDVHQREITAQDVTAEYTDLQIRMKNALAMRDRLEALLKDAKNVEEALQVEEQLSRVSETIEIMKGRLKLLDELATFSTISVTFAERTSQIQSRVRLPFSWLNQLGLPSLLNL